MSFQGRLHFEWHPSIQSLSFEPAAAWTREMWQSIIVNQDGTQNIEFKLQVHDAIYIHIYIYIEKCQNLLIGIWQPMIGIFPSMIGIWQPLIGIWQPLIGIWHVPLKSWNWHPSIQALSTSSRSWLGLEFSAAWTSEMRNNYGCSRTLNTVWYGVVTCGMLILASARCSKNDNRKRYAFGPCCFLQVVARICWMPAQVIFLQVSFDVAYIRDRQKTNFEQCCCCTIRSWRRLSQSCPSSPRCWLEFEDA